MTLLPKRGTNVVTGTASKNTHIQTNMTPDELENNRTVSHLQ